MTLLLSAMSGPDCERIGSGAIRQPINTWTSLAYVAGGILVIARRREWRLERTALVFGVLLITVGTGSAAFHAAAGSIWHWLHDISIVAALAFIAGHEVGRVVRRAPGTVAVALAVGAIVIVAAPVAQFPDATNVVMAPLVVVATVAYAVVRGRGDAGLAWRDLALVVVAALAAASFFLGRTGSPVCAAGGRFQFHGLWHVATAVLAVMWAATALPGNTCGHVSARR